MRDTNHDEETGGTENSAIPERLNASDFTLINSTPETTQMFQMAIDRIQDQDPAGTAIIKAMWLEGGRVIINPYEGVIGQNLHESVIKAIQENFGTDVWLPGLHAVMWNPYSALQVLDDAGNVLGVQSAALALVHESAHAIDPMSISHIKDTIPQYRNLGEYLALSYERMSAANLGEVPRDSWRGTDVLFDNPNVRTGLDPNGNFVWIKTNKDGQTEYGPLFDFQQIGRVWDVAGQGPKFGSPDPHHPGNPYASVPPGTPGLPDNSSPPVDQGGEYGDGDDSGGHNFADENESEEETGSSGSGSGTDGEGWRSEHDPGAGWGGDHTGDWGGSDNAGSSDDGGGDSGAGGGSSETGGGTTDDEGRELEQQETAQASRPSPDPFASRAFAGLHVPAYLKLEKGPSAFAIDAGGSRSLAVDPAVADVFGDTYYVNSWKSIAALSHNGGAMSGTGTSGLGEGDAFDNAGNSFNRGTMQTLNSNIGAKKELAGGSGSHALLSDAAVRQSM